jgi:hypothetical protein
MSRSPLSVKRKDRPDRICPECRAILDLDPERTPRHEVCPECAAIGVHEPATNTYRCLITEEWMNIITGTGFWTLIEERRRVLKKINDPSPRKP